MRTYLVAICASLALFSCNTTEHKTDTSMHHAGQTPEHQIPNPSEVNDPHTAAKPNEARVTHLNWNANLNFEKHIIEATATWDIETSDEAKHIYFDVNGLTIQTVTVDDKEVEFSLSETKPTLGQALEVPISSNSKQVAISYVTAADAQALLWIEKEKTADKNHPFLFTQSQAILARTWIPCQDSPGIRFTYSATVTAPNGMMVLMSATNPQEVSADGTYQFEMKQPIPSYLMALGAGGLEFTPIGNETGIYTEPSLTKASAYEFAELQDMLEAAEAIYGKYAWERYDLLILPPSFPFGGMENPRLTFVTPTIIAGDRSLTALIAHELAHSWSGNLVTNATWDDFWLNEGFTVYFERRIMEALYGRSYSEMLALLGYQDLQETVAELTAKGEAADTKLKLSLAGRNPDDGMTDIAYEKGYFMLRLIEEKVGREAFDQFLNTYFTEHSFKVMTTAYFLQYLNDNLIKSDTALISELRLNDWVFGEGLPSNLPVPQSDRFDKVSAFLTAYLANETVDMTTTDEWTTHEWLHFLRSIPEDATAETVARIDKDFGFTASNNAEVLAAWFQSTIRSNYTEADEKMRSFLVEVGRRKFLTPTYATMKASGKLEQAQNIYKEARPNYHAVAIQTMDELLNHTP